MVYYIKHSFDDYLDVYLIVKLQSLSSRGKGSTNIRTSTTGHIRLNTNTLTSFLFFSVLGREIDQKYRSEINFVNIKRNMRLVYQINC